LADFYEKERVLRQKIVTALVYPLAVLLVAVAVSIYLLVSVVPTFVQAFEEQGVPLPLPTRITISVSRFLLDDWYLAMATGVVLILSAAYGRRTAPGQRLYGRFQLAVPILGALRQKNLLARFARTLALLLSSAVPILDAVRLTGKTLDNDLYRRVLAEVAERLSEGERMHVTLEQHRRLFPPMVTQMIAIGEEAGTLELMLDKLADFFEQEVQEMTGRLHALMEPALILILAALVGGIIVSVYLPMFTMMDAIGQ
jgi:type IV pilus assembly protein PilC